MLKVIPRLLLGMSSLLVLVHCRRESQPVPSSQPEAVTGSLSKPVTARPAAVLDVSSAYPATENVGAKRRIHLEKAAPAEAHSPPDAWKIEFEKTGDFGGICWKNRLGNEGEAPGDDLSAAGYRRISFWAKGTSGGETAEFRAGGLGDIKTRHRDSFDVTAGKIKLSASWNEYSIYVNDVDLSSVMTVFCVLLHREDNAEGAVIYLDDIQYRG